MINRLWTWLRSLWRNRSSRNDAAVKKLDTVGPNRGGREQVLVDWGDDSLLQVRPRTMPCSCGQAMAVFRVQGIVPRASGGFAMCKSDHFILCLVPECAESSVPRYMTAIDSLVLSRERLTPEQCGALAQRISARLAGGTAAVWFSDREVDWFEPDAP